MDEVLERLLDEGTRLFDAGDWLAARKRFAQAKLRAPHDRRALFWLGAAQYHSGRPAEAKRLLEEAADGERPPLPDRPAAVFEYRCRLALGSDLEEAIALGQRGIAADPRDARMRYVLANAYLRRSDHGRALEELDLAFELEGGRGGRPAFPETPGLVPFARSSALTKLDCYEDALAAVDDALAREPRNPLFHNRRGVVLHDGFGRTEEALAAVDRAVALDPRTERSDSDGLYHYNRARYLQELGRCSDALVAVERAVAICALRHYRELRDELLRAVRAGRGAAGAGESGPEPKVAPASADGVADRARAQVPELDFSKVGGMHGLKEQVRRIVRVVHTERAEARRYGVLRNGILLYGPPGCGKTYFAEAVAGEFGLAFLPVSLDGAQSKYVGGAGEKVAELFAEARERTPCLLFFDEFDAFAGRRDDAGSQHGAQMVDALLQEIDRARDVPGLVLAAATNRLHELDPAVIREGRFDFKVEVYKPDFDARREVLQALLAGRPCDAVDVTELAQDTEGSTCAQLRAVVDGAALAAWESGGKIDLELLRAALLRQQTTHRYAGRRMSWSDLILDGDTLRRLQFVERFLENPRLAASLGVEAPRGMLLFGPPGTGKTTIARVLASETDASFFALSSSDVFSKFLGESEARVKQLFERARNNVPAIVFVDEVESILARRTPDTSSAGRAVNSVINTFLAEMDGIASSARVFVIGATNRPELLDEAALRPGRLSELVEIGPPGPAERRAMLALFAARMQLGADVDLDALVVRTEGATGADLKGLCTAAGRHAFLRASESGAQAGCVREVDLEAALDELFPSEGPRARRSRIGF